MRFNAKIGDTKQVHKFLFWPQGKSGDVRWLEWATVIYRRERVVGSEGGYDKWIPIGWADEI